MLAFVEVQKVVIALLRAATFYMEREEDSERGKRGKEFWAGGEEIKNMSRL